MIFVGGMKLFVKEDMLSINIEELNFTKKHRGKKPSSTINVIPLKLARKHCTSKVAEIFDLTGKVSSITASMKMDLQELVHHKLDWDDTIPDDLRPIWESNFKIMKDIGTLRFKHAIIPEDAVDLNINTLDFGDASQSMVCVCIYARFKRRDGTYSCQLVFSSSRVVPQGMSQPRAELYAALINAYAGEVVRGSFKQYHKEAIKFTGSQISLHWITNEEKPLKQWTRNRVIEILRFTRKAQWYYVQTKDMVADIGTRKGVMLEDINQDSVWINGLPLMKLDKSEFPMSTSDEIKLNESESNEMRKEVEVHISNQFKIPNELRDRYAFSNYVIDLNRHTFNKVVRMLAYVIRHCCCLLKIIKKIEEKKLISNQLSEEELKASEIYFFKKGTREIYQFIPPKKFEKFTTPKDNLLIYTGRILPEDQVTIIGRYTEAMKDLSRRSFCVPVLDKDSPVACSIALEVHWNHPACKHSGVKTTLRFIMEKVYIIEGWLSQHWLSQYEEDVKDVAT